ncbi:clumping factor A [Paractinoplanes atraurantiacus]|uniref:Clumping factor A n=1 Tax=Paractinoplanes atraurantiacus TaxID=1036182 RepID=A0A285ISY6_9ACTN|nr:hypothetical protein [Actinoplanes atraurantiacus]SNY51130.1 clumping factor A [Actinoplanes atraurantiacus]
MIVASLLLILVAVALLVMGLTGGSSNLLISSIVASLVAAVFLVVGARQAASARRAAARTTPADEHVEGAYPADDYAAGDYAVEDYPDEAFVAEPEFAAQAAGDPARRRRAPDDPPPPGESFAAESASRDTVQFDAVADTDPHVTPQGPGAVPPGDLSADEAHAAGWRDAKEAMAADLNRDQPAQRDVPGQSAQRDVPGQSAQRDFTDPSAQRDVPGQSAQRGFAGQSGQGDFDDQAAYRDSGDQDTREAGPDYDRASSAINAARSANPGADAWRRDPGAEPEAAAEDDEFAEPDVDDPDDEPLPQSVRPADAVRVARLDAEVLVVDGRPRYHLPDCPHLVGRLTEPIGVGEAVELGFSPCGLCRPVDRLVASAVQR